MRLYPLSSPSTMGTKRRSDRMKMLQFTDKYPRRIRTKTIERMLQKQTVKDVLMNVLLTRPMLSLFL